MPPFSPALFSLPLPEPAKAAKTAAKAVKEEEKTAVKAEEKAEVKASEKAPVKAEPEKKEAAKAIETKKDTTKKLETKAAVLVDTPEPEERICFSARMNRKRFILCEKLLTE